MKNSMFRLPPSEFRPIVLAVLLLLPSGLRAQAHPSFFSYLSPQRYLDAGFATLGSQLVAVPMPPVRGEPGDWRLAVAPAYVEVHADPLQLQGGSLNVAYSRRLENGWGFHGVVLANQVMTRRTSQNNTWDAAFGQSYGFDGTLPFSERYPAGSTMYTAGFFLGATYTWSSWTLFAGPLYALSSAPNLRSENTTTGTYGGGAHTYRSDVTAKNRIDTSAFGVAYGAVTEVDLGSHFRLAPHLYYTYLKNTHWYRKTTLDTSETCDGAACGGSIESDTIGADLGNSGMLMPGLDVVYRDWGLSVNLMQPFGGQLAKKSFQRALHGAWPFSIGVSRSFGTFPK